MYTANSDVYGQYRKTAVMTAGKEKLLLMLYDGLVLALNQARRGIEDGNPAGASRCLVKGQDIIAELMATLNMDYEISANLYRLYEYMKFRLIAANAAKDSAIIDEVLGLATGLRAAWAEAAGRVSRCMAAR